VSERSGFLRDWHFRKEFHAGHVVATLAVLGGMVAVWVDSQRTQAALKAQIEMHERRISLIEEVLREDQTDERLARIEVSIERQTVTIERLLDRYERETERQNQ
jgi:hypothetical protein